MPCGPIPLTSALKNSVMVTSKCSHIDVGAWYCGLLEWTLWSNTSALKNSVMVTSNCSHIAVGVWYCGLLACTLWSNTSDVNTQDFFYGYYKV